MLEAKIKRTIIKIPHQTTCIATTTDDINSKLTGKLSEESALGQF